MAYMDRNDKYIAPPSDGIIKRFFKIVFKTPYRQLPMGEKLVKLIVQLAILAAVIYVAYIVLKLVISLIIVIVCLLIAASVLFQGKEEIHHIDEWGNKTTYRKY